MERILFLDDNLARCRWAERQYPGCRVTHTSEETIDALKAGRFDLVFLDHDLGGEVYVDSGRADCGMEVVRWIVGDRPEIGRLVVHSMNTPAGHAMTRSLREAGYAARYVPFTRLAQGQPVDGGF